MASAAMSLSLPKKSANFHVRIRHDSMRRHLIVTVADTNFVDQAKQLMASAHFGGAWRDDFMLLAFGLSPGSIGWFRDRGILVRECEPIFSEHEWKTRLPVEALHGTSKYTVATMGKFHLLRPEFRRWSTITYLDADIIVRAPLHALRRVRQFSAVPDYGKTLRDQFVDPEYAPQLNAEICELSGRVSLSARCFNAGVFAFPTSVIDNDTFDTIVRLARRYLGLARYGDQLAWNLFFHNHWARLSFAYNYFVYYLTDMGMTARADRFYGAILHFPGLDQRPWAETNVFYPEWIYNLRRAETMDVRIPAHIPLRTRLSAEVRLRLATARDRLVDKTL
jgi:lipopolysaccharide biosynthesis glycosyltransferase